MTGQHIYLAAQAKYAEQQLPRKYYDESPAERREARAVSTRRGRAWFRRHALAS